MIHAIDIAKRYRSDRGLHRWVLQAVNFTIPPKTNVGLIGRNGAGKSTLLRLIAGADFPTRGEVRRECRVSWPLGFAGGLHGSMTGRQNARFVCRIHGLGEDEMTEKLDFVQSFSELGESFDWPIHTYSTGMSARLKFALSLVFDFDVYLTDELTAVGDAAFQKKSRQAFKDLIGRAGLIMVAHQENVLKEYCQAGLLLHEGSAYWFDCIDDAINVYKETLHTPSSLEGGGRGEGN
jgi:capsular polysaccharide transport system ATP-binding protein